MQLLRHDFTLLRQVLFSIVPALAVSHMSLENLHCWACVTCVSQDRTLSCLWQMCFYILYLVATDYI